jgi:hypothetical protein
MCVIKRKRGGNITANPEPEPEFLSEFEGQGD